MKSGLASCFRKLRQNTGTFSKIQSLWNAYDVCWSIWYSLSDIYFAITEKKKQTTFSASLRIFGFLFLVKMLIIRSWHRQCWKASMEAGESHCLFRTVSYSRLHRAVSWQVWSISKTADSTTSLSSCDSVYLPLKKKLFAYLLMECPFFQFVPIAFCPVTWHHWEKSGSIFLILPKLPYAHA